MDKKCSKYEGLFIFSDEKTLKKHLEECEECRLEHEKMQKVSNLLDEVKFHYRSKNKRKNKMLKAVCAMSLLLFSTVMFGAVNNTPNANYLAGINGLISYGDVDDFFDTLKYGDTLSAEDLDFPVDSYGLLTVDEWILTT